MQADVINAEYIRSINKESDTPEAFRLTLGQQQLAAGIQAFQGRIGAGQNGDGGAQRAGFGYAGKVQLALGIDVLIATELGAIDGDIQQLKVFAIQHHCLLGLHRIGLQPQFGVDQRALCVQLEVQTNLRNGPSRRVVVGTEHFSGWRGHSTSCRVRVGENAATCAASPVRKGGCHRSAIALQQ